MAYSLSTAKQGHYNWRPRRDAGLDRLAEFLPEAVAYASQRNFDRPNRQGVSLLSPFLRYRMITEREVVEAVLKAHAYEDVAKFIEEVCWRTYWKGYLEMRPELWHRYQRNLASLQERLTSDDNLAENVQYAREGRTGIACFDAWVDELAETGWLHNHARMWFASIWIFTLRLPWQLGAAFFEEHLLDGDVASNTLSWRWVAGLHTIGKHYVARAGNIRRYTEDRFNPVGELCEDAEPLPLDERISLQSLPEVASIRDMAFPSLSNCPAGLLVFPDDLYPEGSELKETPFCSICLLDGKDLRAQYPRSATATAFLEGACLDASERLARHWNAEVISCVNSVAETFSKASPSHVGDMQKMHLYSGLVDSWLDGVLTWIKNENLKSVWCLRPPVGPWAVAFEALSRALEGGPINMMAYRRRWDALHWHHATHGYFRFKQDLQGRLERSLSKPHQPDLF